MKKPAALFSTFLMFQSLLPVMGQGAAHAEGAAISGVVTLEGARPKPRRIRTDADLKCAAMHADSPLLSDEMVVNAAGQVQHVFVYIKNAPDGDYPVPGKAAVLDQVNCVYTPHVQGIRVGQSLDIVNSDELTHNVRSFPRRNRPFNIGQPTGGTRTKSFSKAEKSIKFKCDIHKWMTSYIFVMEHPFFGTTDATGAFTIKNVPPGQYTFVAWHEKFGNLELDVTMGGKDMRDANFVYVPPAK